MSGRASGRPYDFEHDYDDWAMDDGYENTTFVGVTGATPVFYDPTDGSLFEGTADEENRRIVREGDERTLDVEESIGEAIERFGEEVGWDGLSEWAREHLENGEN